MLKLYFYTGYTKKGEFKTGFIKNINFENLKKELKEKDIFINKVYFIPFFINKEKSEDILLIFTQSKMFIKNGYSFQKILEILSGNKKLKIYVDRMKESLSKGESLYEIFKNSGLNLKESEFMIIKSGEQSGNIYKSFETIEEGIKNREKVKKEISKIMIYPLMIFTIIIFLIIFMGTYILPDFIKIIEMSQQELPLITRIIISFTKNFYLIIVFIILTFIFCINIFRKKKLKEKFFNLFIKIKIFRFFKNKIFISNFTDILGVLLSSGITIIEAIELIKLETEYIYFKEKLEVIEENLKKGKSIGYSLEKINIFSKIDLELIKSGEEAGELVETLFTVSLKNKEYLKEKLQVGIKILEPISIIIIGIITGGIFLGIYLPIFQMMDNI